MLVQTGAWHHPSLSPGGSEPSLPVFGLTQSSEFSPGCASRKGGEMEESSLVPFLLAFVLPGTLMSALTAPSSLPLLSQDSPA